MTFGTFVLGLTLAAKIRQRIRTSLVDGGAIDRGRIKDIFLVQVISVIPGLFGSSSQAALSAVGSTGIALLHIGVQIGLHLCDGCVPGLSENHIIKFFLDDLVEAFLAAVGLRVTRLCPGMLDVVQMKEQLVGMPSFCSRILRSSVGQCPEKADLFLIKKWKNFVVCPVSRNGTGMTQTNLTQVDRLCGVKISYTWTGQMLKN